MKNFKKSDYYSESILVILIPIFLVFSRFLLEISLLLIAFCFLFNSLKEKEFLFYKNNFTLFYFIFFIILILSYLFSEFKNETYTILFYFRFYFYILGLSYFFIKKKKLIYYFFYSIIFIILILIVDASIQFFSGKNILGYTNSEIHRITSFFDDEQIMGSFVAKIFVLLLFAKIIIDKSKKITHIFINLAIFVSPILIFLSGERTSLLMFSLMVFYYLMFLYREKKFKFFYYFSFLSVIFVTVFLLSSKTYYDRYITQTLSSIFDINYSQNKDLLPNQVSKDYNFYFLSAQHQNYMITSLKIFRENRLMGSGPKSFRHSCADENISTNYYSCGTHPHNYYLQLIAETGLVGIIIIISVYIFILIKSLINFYNILTKKKYDPLEIIILGYYFAQLWPLTQTGNFFNNYNSIMFYLPLSIYMTMFFQKKYTN